MHHTTRAAQDIIFPSIEAKRLMDQFVGLVSHVKFGLQLATRESWSAGIAAAHERGFKVFCDTKFKDIPNTVEHAAYALCHHQPDFFTVMADNSYDALRAARLGVDRAVKDLHYAAKPMVIGVTLLTSISEQECQRIYGANASVKTMDFGNAAVAAGFDAIVCSPEELGLFRATAAFDNTLIITPGVRPTWAQANDQQRTATPSEALNRGADMLVIGRPITQPPKEIGSPKEAIKRIIAEIEEVVS
jgi:orotidine-5'-phosphate decarboxylase